MENNTNKRKISSWIFMALFVALAIHFVWCLCVHKDVDPNAEAGNQVQVGGLTVEEVLTENKRLNDQVKALEAENAQLKENGATVNDGKCHGGCPVHCPCSHSNVKTEEGEWTWTKTKTADVCQTGTRPVKTICNDCGEVVKELTETQEDKEHNYNDKGVCSDCGYKKSGSSNSTATTPSACKHSKTEKSYSEWTKINVKTAEACQKATRTVKVICSSCNKVIKTDTEEQVNAKHTFKDHVCQVCGYKCDHSKTELKYGEWTKTEVATKSTCMKAERTVKTVCSTCGKVIKTDTEVQIDNDHDYNSKGVCKECGYGCKHTNTTKVYGKWVIEEVGKANTCLKKTRTVETVCTKCDKVIKESVDTEYDTEHDFEDGECEDCGYEVPACKHSSTKKNTGSWVWDKISTNSCCRYGTRKIETVCSKCGEVLKTETESQYDYDHAFKNGECTDCDYEVDDEDTTCIHSSTKKEYGSWSYEDVSTASCCQHGTRKVKTVCTKCGEVLKTETESKYDYDHDFDGRTCSDCGYKKPLEEGYGEASGEVSAPTNSWSEADDGEMPDPI